MQPQLSFFVELPAAELCAVVQPAVIEVLARRGCRVSMAMIDLGAERAQVIRALEGAGVPVTAWLVLPKEQGYWLNADNAAQAAQQLAEIEAFAQGNSLQLHAVGFDIEPPHDDTVALVAQPARTAWRLWRHRRSLSQVEQAQRQYRQLAAQVAATGRRTEAYHIPLLYDERAAGAQACQRALGIVDVAAGTEVAMLYRSALPPPWGPGLVHAYGPDAQAIAVGITGGGVQSLEPTFADRELDLAMTVAELRAAAYYTQQLYVFSLEGCVRRAMLAELCAADLSPDPRGRHAWPVLATKALRRGLASSLRVGRLAEQLAGHAAARS